MAQTFDQDCSTEFPGHRDPGDLDIAPLAIRTSSPCKIMRTKKAMAIAGLVVLAVSVPLLTQAQSREPGSDLQTRVGALERTASEFPTGLFGFGKQEVGIAVGRGLAIPIGGTDGDELRDVQFIYVAPRWGIGISDPMGGDAWYRGNFEFLFEGAFLINVEPKSGFAGGATAMFRYNFLPKGKFIPFLQLGGGIVGLDFNLQDQADGFNFTPQGGFGFHYFVSERTAFTGEWRFHHISNAGIHDDNDGINDSLFLLGITIFLEP